MTTPRRTSGATHLSAAISHAGHTVVIKHGPCKPLSQAASPLMTSRQ